jgi:DNA-binding LacI/PurR family transcriptional regulator
MQDIAARVGVSQATVSYVLNARPDARVSPETRRRVLEAAAELRYRPNAIARAMASGRSRTIGVYQPHAGETPLSGMWTASVMLGISEALHARHLHLLLYGYRESEEPPPETFLDGRVDGLIIIAPHTDDALPGHMAGRDFPTAIVGAGGFDGARTVSVDADNAAGARLAVQHLLSLGHTRIVHLAGPDSVPNALDRRAGYEQAMRARGLPVESDGIVPGGFDMESGEKAARAALCRAPRPTALFVANDIAALGALRACAELGLRVPEDVSVVGYDDAPVCELTRPPLTTMRQPAREMGRAAAEMLLALLDGAPPAETRRLFAAELVVRESCAAPPAR